MLPAPNDYYRTSSSSRPPLRLGLLLDSAETVPAFVAAAIEEIKATNFACIELVVVAGEPDVKSRASKPGAARPNPRLDDSFLYELYLKKLDARMKPEPDPLATVDSKHLLAGIEVLTISAGPHDSNRFTAEAVAAIRGKNLDVLLLFISEFEALSGDILQAARYGVWALLHGVSDSYRGGPPLFRELREGSPLSGVALQILRDEPDRGPVLSQSLFATEQTLSVSRNRYVPYWASKDLPLRKLHELHQLGWDHLIANAIPPARGHSKPDSHDAPTNQEMLSWLGPILLKKAVAYPLRRQTMAHWRIAIRSNARPLYEPESDPAGFRWIEAPPGRAWADPFVFEHEGKFWVFFEDYFYENKRASLACAEILPNGELGPVIPCLDHPSHHYSYPYVFRAGADIFMIPESFDSNSVDLYRCLEFPQRWTLEAPLLRGKFVDTTVWDHGGLWWLATTSAEPWPGAGALFLYYAESLTGEWKFHPANPISTDIRTNRGAGRVFRSQGRLIRPSQSCAPTYGYSITWSEITELSPERYAERPMRTIGPEHWKGLTGVHTYNCGGNFEFIDGQKPLPLRRLLATKR
jgi:hypothetical protein